MLQKTFLIILITLLCTCLPMKTSARMNGIQFIRLKSFDGYFHTKYNLSDVEPVSSKLECSVRCVQNLECSSFFYLNGHTKYCSLHSVLFTDTDEAMAESTASYYQLSDDECPAREGYITHRPASLCYRYVDQDTTWEMAYQNCALVGEHLLFIKTPQVSEHITRFLLASSGTRQKHFNVGAKLTNGVYTWTDNTAVSWTNWGSGEPTGGDEGCLSLAWFFYFRWNDVPCTAYSRPYICQRNMN